MGRSSGRVRVKRVFHFSVANGLLKRGYELWSTRPNPDYPNLVVFQFVWKPGMEIAIAEINNERDRFIAENA